MNRFKAICQNHEGCEFFSHAMDVSCSTKTRCRSAFPFPMCFTPNPDVALHFSFHPPCPICRYNIFFLQYFLQPMCFLIHQMCFFLLHPFLQYDMFFDPPHLICLFSFNLLFSTRLTMGSAGSTTTATGLLTTSKIKPLFKTMTETKPLFRVNSLSKPQIIDEIPSSQNSSDTVSGARTA